MSSLTKISIDAFGGDFSFQSTVPATLNVLDTNKNIFVYLVGDKEKIYSLLNSNPLFKKHKNRIEVIPTTQVVEMDESPVNALKKKKDSSMYQAINLVKENKASACVSSGNTGALMAISRSVLKMIPGIKRPALFGSFPTMKGFTHMLDLGAGIDDKPQSLLEFAIMGSVTLESAQKINKPTVGLLNVGSEDIKGTKEIKEASQLLKDSGLNYIGFVEGNDIYKGSVDLIVANGFVGNITLKASEGVATMFGFYLKQAFTKNILTKLIALLASKILKSFKTKIDPRTYNGATFLGLKGIVIKSHGGADIYAFEQAIKEAIKEAIANVPKKIEDKITLK
jgi:glycerol-3-phosphate acyltransferase PlsX